MFRPKDLSKVTSVPIRDRDRVHQTLAKLGGISHPFECRDYR
jgi:hypothetical protein